MIRRAIIGSFTVLCWLLAPVVASAADRSRHGETSEAVYLNSGFVYPDAETAAARFAGEDDGFVYARYGNPTVEMFEQRMCLLEGAEACYGTASGMSAVFGALASQVEAGDHIVAAGAVHPLQGVADADVAQVTDVEDLVGVRLAEEECLI